MTTTSEKVSIQVLLVENQEEPAKAFRDVLDAVKAKLRSRNIQIECTVEHVRTMQGAKNKHKPGAFHAAFVDYDLDGETGNEVARMIRTRDPDIPCFMITAVAKVDQGYGFLKDGIISDFIEKPIEIKQLTTCILKVIAQLAAPVPCAPTVEMRPVLGNNATFVAAREKAGRAAKTDSTILLLGDTGVGKENFARWIHYNSPRRRCPFVAINLNARAPNLVLDDLFGHSEGAFSGASADQRGYLADADGGTVFLDEIGDIAPELQVRLLRVIQEREVERLGDHVKSRVDVRIIAATNARLDQKVAEGTFRQDLYYRLRVVEVMLPPLRDRRDDIMLLAEHFLETWRQRKGRRYRLAGDAQSVLLNHSWPGNVRELELLIEGKIATLGDGEEVSITTADMATSWTRQSSHDDDIIGKLQRGELTWRATSAQMDGVLRQLLPTIWQKSGRNAAQASRLLGYTDAGSRGQFAKIAERLGYEYEP